MRLRKNINLLVNTFILYLIIFSGQKEMVVLGLIVSALSHSGNKGGQSDQGEITRYSFFESEMGASQDVADQYCAVNGSEDRLFRNLKRKIIAFEDYTSNSERLDDNRIKATDFVFRAYKNLLTRKSMVERVAVLSNTPGFGIKIKLFGKNRSIESNTPATYDFVQNSVNFYLNKGMLDDSSYIRVIERKIWHEYWHAEIAKENRDKKIINEHGSIPVVFSQGFSDLSKAIDAGLKRVDRIVGLLNSRKRLTRNEHKIIQRLRNSCEDYIPEYFTLPLNQARVEQFRNGKNIVSAMMNGHEYLIKINTIFSHDKQIKGFGTIYFKENLGSRDLRQVLTDIKIISDSKAWEQSVIERYDGDLKVMLKEREAHLVGELPPALREALFPEVMEYHRKRSAVEKQVESASLGR